MSSTDRAPEQPRKSRLARGGVGSSVVRSAEVDRLSGVTDVPAERVDAAVAELLAGAK
jgi:hypothetical protein